MFRRRQVLTHTYADANTEDEALLAFALDDAREDEPEETRIARDSARMSCPPLSSANASRRSATLGRTRTPHARSKDCTRSRTRVARTPWQCWRLWDDGTRRANGFTATAAVAGGRSTVEPDADALATCLHSFARVDHAVLPSGSMKTLIQIARDVIVPLASVGAPMGGDAETDAVEDPPRRHPIAAARLVMTAARGAPRAPTPSGHPWNC